MSGFRLQEEEKVQVLLNFVVIQVMSLSGVNIFKGSFNLMLLVKTRLKFHPVHKTKQRTYLIQRHSVLNQESNTRV
jgi:hypothetical protein